MPNKINDNINEFQVYLSQFDLIKPLLCLLCIYFNKMAFNLKTDENRSSNFSQMGM
jgi:hypothetical protein